MSLNIKEDKPRFMCRNKILKTLLLAIVINMTALADDVLLANPNYNITVFYPELRKPYSTFFEAIIDGIKENTNGKVILKPISKSMQPSDIARSLDEQKPDAAILLGGGIKSLSSNLNGPYKLVYGASFFSNKDIQSGLSGISITPDPGLLFSELKKLSSTIKYIHVVYHPSSNGWLVKKARKNATTLGIRLVEHPVESTQQAATAYLKIAQMENHAQTALWLLQHDPTLDEKSLLPKILADAWQYEQLVISSNPSHVKRGALLSLLPDNNRLGRDLAKKTIRILNGQQGKIEPMQSTLMALNIRTAKHLSLTITPSQESRFTLIFPRKNNK
ncbi:MAG: ABC transporter substrate binding protein [Cycloclasticus sp.]